MNSNTGAKLWAFCSARNELRFNSIQFNSTGCYFAVARCFTINSIQLVTTFNRLRFFASLPDCHSPVMELWRDLKMRQLRMRDRKTEGWPSDLPSKVQLVSGNHCSLWC